MRFRAFSVLLSMFLSWSGATAHAGCEGSNLYDALDPDQRAEIEAKVALAPFGKGNFWIAEKDDDLAVIIGSYHLGDPRHQITMAGITPLVSGMTQLLVEAGPAEEAALKERLAQSPEFLVSTTGPTLPERLTAAEWAQLKTAMAGRGIPGFMAAKFKPWYLSSLLGIPACAMTELARREGLDHQLITLAETAGIPVQALEPYDTLFTVFGDLTDKEEIDMIRTGLAMEAMGSDMMVTLSDLYFDGNARAIWEFSKALSVLRLGYSEEQVALEFGIMEERLVNRRNTAWIAKIEEAAAQGPIMVAFGALHLSGDQGVLNLLAQRGWNISPQDLSLISP